jgi:hypothetical protein
MSVYLFGSNMDEQVIDDKMDEAIKCLKIAIQSILDYGDVAFASQMINEANEILNSSED